MRLLIALLLFFVVSPMVQAEPIKEDQIADYFKAQAALPEEARRDPTLTFAKMATGDIGVFPNTFDPEKPKPYVITSVDKIIDAGAMVVKVDTYSIVRKPATRNGMEFLGPEIPEFDRSEFVILEGISTEGFKEGKSFQAASAYKVSGTRKVFTSVGLKTVNVLERYRLPPLR